MKISAFLSKMLKKYLKRKNSIISVILIVTTITMPLAFLPAGKTYAQNLSTTDYISGFGSAVGTLPLCREMINSKIASLFQPAADFLTNVKPNAEADKETGTTGSYTGTDKNGIQIDVLGDIPSSADTKLSQLSKQYSELSNSIQTSDPVAQAQLKDLQKKIDAIKQSTEYLQENDTCLQSIGRLMIKIVLQKITLSTVNWINHGFNGGPAFVQNPGQYFKDIAKNQILEFGTIINDPNLYPYGQSFMQNEANAFKSKFATNAQYSLNNLIRQTSPQYTAQGFQNDFSQGGWDAWSYMTQIPANNPLGFQLMAAKELQRRIQENQQQTQNQLTESGGFLGDIRCVDPSTGKPNDITQAKKEAALSAGKKDPCTTGGGQWQYVTPGKLIATAATTALNYPNNNLLKASDLNDAIAAITDAIINHFTSQWQTSGFTNISSQGANGQLVHSSGYINDSTTQTQKDFAPFQLTSSWLAANPNFNIRTDLTQALIDEQRTYVEKLKDQDNELLSTTDGKEYSLNERTGVSNAYGLIPAIYQLDYCIPGPHPGWQTDSRNTLTAVSNAIVPETKDTLDSMTTTAIMDTARSFAPLVGAAVGTSIVGAIGLGAALGSFVPVVGTIIGAAVGALISFVLDAFSGGDGYAKVRLYYSTQLRTLTGLNPADEGSQAATNNYRHLNIQSKQAIVNDLNTFLDRYIKIMNKTYFSSPDILPAVAPEAADQFNKVKGYGKMRSNNQEEIANMNSVITQLQEIKDAVDGLNVNLASEKITKDEYETSLRPQIDAFGRVSASMVNANDIAAVDNMTKQIIDEKNYIYNSLLKGPNGCEAELEKPQKKFPFKPEPTYANGDALVENPKNTWDHFDANSVERMKYPYQVLPILYDYDHFIKGNNLPDPWGEKSDFCKENPTQGTCQYHYVNQMPDAGTNMYTYDSRGNITGYKYGPGFLSFVFFGNHPGGVPSCATPCREGSERLETSDIIPPSAGSDSKYRAVGLRAPGPGGLDHPIGGPFETSIGIY